MSTTPDPRYRLLALIRDRFTCQRCGATNDLTVHHCIPIRERGPGRPWNLLTICDECHKFIEGHPEQTRGEKTEAKAFRRTARRLAVERRPPLEPWCEPGLHLARIQELRDEWIEQELLSLADVW